MWHIFTVAWIIGSILLFPLYSLLNFFLHICWSYFHHSVKDINVYSPKCRWIVSLWLETFPSFPLTFKECFSMCTYTNMCFHGMSIIPFIRVSFFYVYFWTFHQKSGRKTPEFPFRKWFSLLHFIFKCQIHMEFMLIVMRIRHLALLLSK